MFWFSADFFFHHFRQGIFFCEESLILALIFSKSVEKPFFMCVLKRAKHSAEKSKAQGHDTHVTQDKYQNS